jgi:methionine-rich copper-binding protein CopC
VVARREPETGFDPALQDGPFPAVRIKTPAPDHLDVVGLGPRIVAAGEAHFLRPFEPEAHRHVVAEDVRTIGVGGGFEAAEEIGVEFGDAVEEQRRRMALVGEAAEDDCREVAAVDGQTGVAGSVALSSPLQDVGDLSHPYIPPTTGPF